jgi:hypothetical protein
MSVIQEGFCEAGDDGRLVWKETHQHELKDTGCIYICYDPNRGEDEDHMVHMLVAEAREGKKGEEPTFFWTTLWNTSGVTGVQKSARKWQHKFPSIEEAIRAKLKVGWTVKRTYFSKIFRGLPL